MCRLGAGREEASSWGPLPAARTGHFTAHVADSRTGQWFCHNDAHTSPLDVDGSSVVVDRQKDCYVLLYQHAGA